MSDLRIDKTKILGNGYSTTRLLTKEKPVIENKAEDKFESVIFLAEGEERKGEGGLRTQGYFKKSYENKPLISIITVVYNGEQFLEETILSVINQSYDNVEYIIIDGGSTDGTLDIIKKYTNQIDYWVSEKDAGIYDAMNKGVDLVSGGWINFMNGGDVFYDTNIILSIFKNNTAFSKSDIIYGNLEVNYGKFKRIIQAKSLKNIYKGMIFSHQASFISGKYHKLNKYSLEYSIAGDFDFFYYAYQENQNFTYIDQIISTNSVEGVSDSNRLKTLRQKNKIVNKYGFVLVVNIYYVYLYLDEIIRKITKFFLPVKVINYIKKRK